MKNVYYDGMIDVNYIIEKEASLPSDIFRYNQCIISLEEIRMNVERLEPYDFGTNLNLKVEPDTHFSVGNRLIDRGYITYELIQIANELDPY
jgi:hypothetical protein